jgi:hypothetical protein
MRIVIEIDGDQVSASNVPSLGEGAAPPPEVLKAAAAIGAMSAGPAPTQPGPAGRLESLTAVALEAMGGSPLDAGSAPARAGRREAAEQAEKPVRPARTSARARPSRGRGTAR